MIANENQTDNSFSMVETIRRSPIEFHLTGSRFFGNNTPESDWDFFVEESKDLRFWLATYEFLQEGFDYGIECEDREGKGRFAVPEEHRTDPCISEVWVYSGLRSSTLEKIHIQVIKSEMMWLKIAAQYIIKAQNLMGLAPRHNGMFGFAAGKKTDYKLLSRAIWISVMRTLLELQESLTTDSKK